MDEDSGICGRGREIKEIHNFVTSKIESKQSGILYLTGPPGTGKTMSVDYVLSKINNVPKLKLNCMRAQKSKVILTKICRFVGLDKFINHNESEMISRLSRKFCGRTSETYVIALDEVDQIPKSRNVDLFRTIFTWQNQTHSKLIIIGISNTFTLTTKCEMIGHIMGRGHNQITKIVFKPYTSKDIKAILQWYLENDENFEDAIIEPKALDLISVKFARDKQGDIRGAIDALMNSIDDTVRQITKPSKESQNIMPTPPSTPPPSPCKERTNITSVANSIKKRQRSTHYMDDVFPFAHQVILVCLFRISSKTKSNVIDSKTCHDLVDRATSKYGLMFSVDDYRSMIDNLEVQGMVEIKKGKPREKIVLKSSEEEVSCLLKRKDMILELLNNMV